MDSLGVGHCCGFTNIASNKGITWGNTHCRDETNAMFDIRQNKSKQKNDCGIIWINSGRFERSGSILFNYCKDNIA